MSDHKEYIEGLSWNIRHLQHQSKGLNLWGDEWLEIIEGIRHSRRNQSFAAVPISALRVNAWSDALIVRHPIIFVGAEHSP